MVECKFDEFLAKILMGVSSDLEFFSKRLPNSMFQFHGQILFARYQVVQFVTWLCTTFFLSFLGGTIFILAIQVLAHRKNTKETRERY